MSCKSVFAFSRHFALKQKFMADSALLIIKSAWQGCFSAAHLLIILENYDIIIRWNRGGEYG